MMKTIAGFALLLCACGGSARLPVEAGMGPTPELPAPRKSLIPVVSVAAARSWRDGEAPTAAPGLTVARFAEGLEHPRWLEVLPNGDVLVAESNGPARPEDEAKGIRGWFFRYFFRKAGAAVKSPDQIVLLREALDA